MSQRTVLCALEDRDLSRIFEKALAGAGYKVLSVFDGIRALSTWREVHPALLIADISLPRCDGFELVSSVRREGNNGPAPSAIILLSDSRISPHYQERADSLGVELLLAKPVPLELLLNQVRRLLKPAIQSSAFARQRVVPGSDSEPDAEVAVAVGMKPHRSAQPMRGTFSELPFPRLLHQLHGLRASGVLMLESGRKRKAIELREGVPIAIKSNLIHECLGNVLVRAGVLNEPQHQESLARMKKGEGLQGEILLALQFVDEETLATALCEQAREKLFEIFEWREGRFEFGVGQKIKRANALALNSSTANVILEGVRFRYPIAAIDHFLSAHRGRYLSPAASSFFRFQEIDLEAEEAAMVAQFDGLHPIGDYASASEGTRRALFGLLVTGMFELAQNEATRDTAEGSGPEKPQPRRQGRCQARPRARPRDEATVRAELSALAQNLRDKNHFELFGVAQACTQLALEEAYSDLARRVHPDRFQTKSLAIRELASAVNEQVREAYETLHDPRCRQQYILELQLGAGRVKRDESGRRALAAETAFQKGMGLMQKRAHEEALMQFGKSLEQNPADGEYHAYYGWCLYLCHPNSSVLLNEAIEHVKRGARLAGDREQPYLFLGRLYKVMGKVGKAERMFTRAVQIQPGCIEALRELRLINLRRQKGRGLIQRILRH